MSKFSLAGGAGREAERNISDGMAGASVEDEMGVAAPSCVDAWWGKMSADALGTSGYAEELIEEERCWCWIVVCGLPIDCWLS